jgi:hypothetical protein
MSKKAVWLTAAVLLSTLCAAALLGYFGSDLVVFLTLSLIRSLVWRHTVASLLFLTIVVLGAMSWCAVWFMRREPGKESELGIASCFVGAAMLVLQLDVFAAVALGVRDSEGIMYVPYISVIIYLFGIPLGLLLAGCGFLQPNRKRKYAVIGLCLTLGVPTFFVCTAFCSFIWSLLR